jgi:hypothetical protein
MFVKRKGMEKKGLNNRFPISFCSSGRYVYRVESNHDAPNYSPSPFTLPLRCSFGNLLKLAPTSSFRRHIRDKEAMERLGFSV